MSDPPPAWQHHLQNAGRSLLQGVLQLLYANVCWGCGAALRPHQKHFCKDCRDSLSHDRHDTCPHCSSTVGPFSDVSNGCPACRDQSFAFDRTFRLGPYEGVLRELVLKMKHHSGEVLAELLGELWAEQLAPRLRSTPVDAVVPIPLHWWRRLRRGYNQSATLARALSRRLGIPLRTGWLWRTRNTPRQTYQMSPQARRDNVHGAFRLGPRVDVRGKTILLVDDVLTTGATASEAARPLRAAGAARVLVAVLRTATGKFRAAVRLSGRKTGPTLAKTPRAPRSAVKPVERIPTLDALRGLAALAVCWHHFQNAMHLIPAGTLGDLADYGWLGVDVFFVLSGFVIPYSLSAAGYSVRHYGLFLRKRLLRVEPPYLAAVLLALALSFASARMPEGYRGAPFVFDPVQLALHVGYLNALFQYPWLNEVFWTLAIEFQYYLLIGLLYGFVVHPSRAVRVGFYLTLAGISLLPAPKSCVVPYWGEFLLGIACFHLRQGAFGRPVFLGTLAALGAAVHVALGLPHALAALAAALVIAFVRVDISALNRLGQISFSLYLVHGPVGERVGKVVLRLTGTGAGKPLALAVSLTLTIAFAYLFYRLVERPATRWAARVRYPLPEPAAPQPGDKALAVGEGGTELCGDFDARAQIMQR